MFLFLGDWQCIFYTDLSPDSTALKSQTLKASKHNNNIICHHIHPIMSIIYTYTSKSSQRVIYSYLVLSRGWAHSSLSHMDSNSSMRCLVLPWRIWRKVLYLSRPAFTFSAWIRSLGVFLLSSTAPASSVLRNWKRAQTHSEWNLLPWESSGDYSGASSLSPHPCPPLTPQLKTLYCP